MARHHAEPIIKILSTRNVPFDSDVRQGSHPFMIPLHCLWTKSNNRTRGQFECGVNCFCSCFDFVPSYACYDLEGGESFEMGRPRWTRWKNFGCIWTGGEESWKLDNFHGRHMCYFRDNCYCLKSLQDTCTSLLILL